MATCDASSTGNILNVNANPDLDGSLSSGQAVRFHQKVVDATAGIEASWYQSDDIAPGAPIVIGAQQEVFLMWFSIMIGSADSEVILYRGSATSHDTTVNAPIWRGNLAANGGIVSYIPALGLGLGQKLYAKTFNAGATLNFSGMGRLVG